MGYFYFYIQSVIKLKLIVDKIVGGSNPVGRTILIMKQLKCEAKDCKRILDVPDEMAFAYCSFECAIYDGVYSVNTGLNREELQRRLEWKKQKKN